MSCFLKTLSLLLSIASLSYTKTCNLDENAEIAVTEAHNKYREDIAKGKVLKGSGSRSLFALKYDCIHEALAATPIGDACENLGMQGPLKSLSKSYNFESYRTPSNPADVTAYYQMAVDDWKVGTESNKFTGSTNVKFARMVNYRAYEFGCTHKYCADNKKLAIVCLYNSELPAKDADKDLWEAYATTKGCTKNSTCKLVKDALKEIDADLVGACDTSTGLCVTEMKETPPTTTTATPSTTVTTQPTTTITTNSNEKMTDEIREHIITMHNYRRANLAKGSIRNGKEGNPNCPTAQNMYEMRYDMDLETEAQTYANQCPTKRSTMQGENFQKHSSITISYYDAAVEAIKTWWKQISTNGINAQMLYTQTLETKTGSPNMFTQVGWAKSYKVGCGISRCTDGTVVVCRYNPRGNVYQEYIYKKGTTCGACAKECKDGLCPAPAE
ncbi:unnamed protein product [Cylicocyclus nassatus]|uniref:SCP domain-containing protein n=1 Tax=Cylicocyclus nassatus TaxID=53992 RepID=A0AA36GNU3_CYLNA|nr:unnamed protein product [Cylicocyclus nassatus]